MSDDLLPGFASHWIDTEAGRIFARSAGRGPPLALLHGFPQTHVSWHRVAPALAETYTVVCLDLRGYGWSSVPRSDARHLTYSKRAMARDVVEVMEQLGHVHFALVGHDRGARVAYRLALDHPGRLERLALLDIVPTFANWERVRAGLTPTTHWNFLASPYPEPETEIGRDPIAYYEGLLRKWSGGGSLDCFDPRALASYQASWNEPSRIHASCEDYRAGATLDLQHDEEDRQARRTISCPTIVVWGEYLSPRGTPESETPLAVWRASFAPGAAGATLRAGHFLAEEDPAGTLAELRLFLSARHERHLGRL